MKRLLLGLSVASGLAIAGVFAFAQLHQGGGANANAAAGAATQGQGGASPDPWVQPMPKGVQDGGVNNGAFNANGASNAVGSDPFAGATQRGQQNSISTSQTANSQSQPGASGAAGVRIRNVNSRQVVEDQATGHVGESLRDSQSRLGETRPRDETGPGGVGNGADPFANSPPAGPTKSQPGAAQRGNESKFGGGLAPLPSEQTGSTGGQANGLSANPLRGGQNSAANGGAAGFYDAADGRGATQGARGATPNELPAVSDGRRPAPQEPGAFPPPEFTDKGPPGGPAGALDRGLAGAAPNNLEQGFGNASGRSAALSGSRESLGNPSGGRQFAGQLASATIRTEGSGLPGGKQLEGNQLPTLAIQKFAPPEIQVNKLATFEIHVRNTGPVTAREVVIQDRVPQGTQFVRSSPDTVPSPQGDLEWRFDALPPKEQRVIKVEVRPLKRGEIGSVATVRFSADATARSKCTCPELRVEATAQRQTLIGDPLVLTIAVTNTGDGAATGVVVAEQVPDKFEHTQGQLLENELGTLKPGESRELKLTLKAARAGMALNRVLVRADGDNRVEKPLELEVIAPALKVDVQGPKQQFLQREATYSIQVDNQGTAAAKTVRLSALVPTGFRFVAANNYGEFDPKTGRVIWELVELPAGQKDRVELKLLAAEPGVHQLQIEGRAQRNVQASGIHQVGVEGVVAVRFEVVHRGNALEVGAEKSYEIKVANDGTQAATDVYVEAVLPATGGLQALAGNGPLQGKVTPNGVTFGPLPRLAPRADTSFFVNVRAQAAGDYILRFQVRSAEQQTPIGKEEILRVR